MKEMCFAKDCEGSWYFMPYTYYTSFKEDDEKFSRSGNYELMDFWQDYRVDSPDGFGVYVD